VLVVAAVSAADRAPHEANIRARAEARELDEAAAETIRLYGAELFGFLLAIHGHDEDAAADVFSTVCVQLWRGLEAFRWKSSLRTWAYATARNASSNYRRDRQRRTRRLLPLSGCPAVAEIEARVRTETLSHLRTDRRDEIRRLREELPEEDQTLLILRVDRELSWQELAAVFLGDCENTAPEVLARESARLRKRFQLVKQRLQTMGVERGLFPSRRV
jgi:RNA polymerase sigma-70 factor (ECF subfamily)